MPKIPFSSRKMPESQFPTAMERLFVRREFFGDAFTDAVVAEIEAGALDMSDLRSAKKTTKIIRALIERIAAALGMA